jgi:hypothetical protein
MHPSHLIRLDSTYLYRPSLSRHYENSTITHRTQYDVASSYISMYKLHYYVRIATKIACPTVAQDDSEQ